MKLLHKSNWYLFLVSFIILCIGGVLFFILFDQIIEFDLNNRLERRKKNITEKLTESDSIVKFQHYSENKLLITELTTLPENSSEELSDTVIFDNIESKNVTYRKLSFYVQARNLYYRVELRRPLLDKNQLIGGIIILVLLIIIVFSSILFFLNRQLFKSTWAPFHAILENIKNYNIDNASKLHLPKSSVEEFDLLSSEITFLTHKIQKEFIENTSHEMKTPLAIINNKLELLLQSNNLSAEQLESVNSSLRATKRLAKLNDSLLILARIKNKQFHHTKTINLNSLISEHLHNLAELTEARGMSITVDFSNEIHLEINPFLADILLENLISNAILHNNNIGTIVIQITTNTITIINSGDEPKTNPSTLFDRFNKAGNKTNSLGLGLSIVKSICDTYNFKASYEYENGKHYIEIYFNQ